MSLTEAVVFPLFIRAATLENSRLNAFPYFLDLGLKLLNGEGLGDGLGG